MDTKTATPVVVAGTLAIMTLKGDESTINGAFGVTDERAKEIQDMAQDMASNTDTHPSNALAQLTQKLKTQPEIVLAVYAYGQMIAQAQENQFASLSRGIEAGDVEGDDENTDL